VLAASALAATALLSGAAPARAVEGEWSPKAGAVVTGRVVGTAPGSLGPTLEIRVRYRIVRPATGCARSSKVSLGFRPRDPRVRALLPSPLVGASVARRAGGLFTGSAALVAGKWEIVFTTECVRRGRAKSRVREPVGVFTVRK
jgi:hypothetical protein